MSAHHLRILLGSAAVPAVLAFAASPWLADGQAVRVGAACAMPIALGSGWMVHRALLAPLPRLLAAMLGSLLARLVGIVGVAVLLGARGVPYAPALLTVALCLSASVVADAALAGRRLSVEGSVHG